MATIGQVIYNLQDYSSSGGYLSTSKSNLSSTVSSAVSSYDTAKIDIFNTNIVELYGGSGFTKLGIQAPSGTRAILNTNKTILIGRTGIYELDDDITVTSLVFVRPKKYVKDDQATNEALQKGIEGFVAAEETRDSSLSDLKLKEPYLTDTEYWQEYSSIQSIYEAAYQEALTQFNNGVNGIYKLPNSANPTADENYQDLYNIIIDFIY